MTSIDTNVFISLWDKDDVFNLNAQKALDKALAAGSLVVTAPVYAELLAGPSRTERALDHFFRQAEIKVDWQIPERVWRVAAFAAQAHGIRRRASKGGGPRRIMADFVIGAHAFANGYSLLTLDGTFFERNFPGLTVKSFQ